MPSLKKLSTGDESSSTEILIRAFGEFWSADWVDWEKSEPLIWGKRSKAEKSQLIDVYEERGVYVLFNDFTPVYVGKADNEPLGSRLRKQKRAAKRGPRWDRFSWFGIRAIDPTGNVQNKTTRKTPVSSDVLIETLEAVLILAINPLLNARSESFKGAERLYQSDTGRPKTKIEAQLMSIEEKLDRLVPTKTRPR